VGSVSATAALEPFAPGETRHVVADRYRPRDQARRRMLAGADVLALSLALAIAFGRSEGWDSVAWGLATLPGWIAIFAAYGLYGRDLRRVSHSTVDDLGPLLHSLLLGCLLLWLYYHAVPSGTVHFKYVLVFAACAVVLTTGLRSAGRLLLRRMLGPERALLVGDQDGIAVLARKLRDHPEYGVEPVWLSGLAPMGLDGLTGSGLDVLARELDVERLIVSHPGRRQSVLAEIVHRAHGLGLKVSLVQRTLDVVGPAAQVDHVEGQTVLALSPPVLSRSSRFLKRAMDIAGALAILILTAPVAIVIALAIKLDSHGTVLYRQERIGRGGRRFSVIKFRTMVMGADRLAETMLAQSRDPNWLLLDSDPRITQVGRILRRTSLDELPQAWNVLRGDMSLVGPRPLVESEYRRIRGHGRCRIDLTPGLTGLWQVLGRTNIPFAEMVELDYQYITNWSLWGDVKLLLSTIPALVSTRGAN
jgi:exopolysaccharide biosynthesis polyprenyl glycosylphosphotransferase